MSYQFSSQVEFRRELTRIARDLGMSQPNLAATLKISPRTAYAWLHGAAVPPCEREGVLHVLRSEMARRRGKTASGTPLFKKKLGMSRKSRYKVPNGTRKRVSPSDSDRA